jgi:L-rhamnose isomerase/sugar isomerase
MSSTAPDTSSVKAALRQQRIELPSWAFGNSGTRFKVFGQPGVPRDPYEKVADAAQVHTYTGVAPSVALHIPWDAVDDYADLAKHADDHGVRIGTINANVFQDDDYKLGSVCHPDAGVRRKALDHLLECVDVMDATGSRDLKLWFADGTNYPGQDSIRSRQDRLAEALAATYERLGSHQRLLLEYKLFEPAFYHTDVPDWGTAYAHCLQLGDQAKVVVDTSTTTTTSWSAPPTPSSCSGSCTRWSREAGTRQRPASPSCSTRATTSNPRSPGRSARS